MKRLAIVILMLIESVAFGTTEVCTTVAGDATVTTDANTLTIYSNGTAVREVNDIDKTAWNNAAVQAAAYAEDIAGTMDMNDVDANKYIGNTCPIVYVAAYDTVADACVMADYKCSDANAETAINTAISASPAGGEVWLLPGTYPVNVNVLRTGSLYSAIYIPTSNMTLKGLKGAKIIPNADSAVIGKYFVLIGDNTTDIRNVNVTGIQIFENPTNYATQANYGIYITKTENVKVEDCNITSGFAGVFTKGTGTRIINNNFIMVGDESIQGGTTASTAVDIFIYGNRILKNAQRSSQSAIRLENLTGGVISNNIITGSKTYGISFGSSSYACQNVVFSNNVLYDNNTAEIYLAAKSKNITITNNYIGSTSSTNGILQNSLSAGYGYDLIANNTFNMPNIQSGMMSGTFTGSKIFNNIGADSTLNASATALPFGVTHLAGTTASQTITLGDGYCISDVKTFDMNDATNPKTLTVTHDANGTGGSSSYIFNDVNDFTQFVWNGKQWKCSVDGHN